MRKFSTRAIHDGEGPDRATGAHNTPIYQTATFSFDKAEDMAAAVMDPMSSFFYSRTANPTTAALEKKMASLEGTEAALVTSLRRHTQLISLETELASPVTILCVRQIPLAISPEGALLR